MFDILTVLLWFSAITSGLIGGVLLALSTIVGDALARINRAAAIPALDAIAAPPKRSVFLILLIATSLACVALGALVAPEWARQFAHDGAAIDRSLHSIMMGCVAFLVGVLAPTLMGSRAFSHITVRFAPDGQGEGWPLFLRVWMAYNLIRLLGATFAMASFIGALAVR